MEPGTSLRKLFAPDSAVEAVFHSGRRFPVNRNPVAPCPAPPVPLPIGRSFRVLLAQGLLATCRRRSLTPWGTGSRQLLFDPRLGAGVAALLAKDPDRVLGVTQIASLSVWTLFATFLLSCWYPLGHDARGRKG